jgi:hypothetical protein
LRLAFLLREVAVNKCVLILLLCTL